MKLASLTDLMISTASTGDWGNLPEEFQTEANLLLPDRHGWTAAHHAASEGMLHRIPEKLLTERVLTVAAPAGVTPVGLAAEMEWQNLPYEVLRMHKNLLAPEVWQKIRAHLGGTSLVEMLELTNGDPFDPAETLEDLS